MLKRKNKVCHTCSTEYKFCTGCADYDHLPRWMALFHNDNCRMIFNTISSYNVGHITKSEAAEQLRGCDLSYKNKMKPNIVEKIDMILCDEPNADKLMTTDTVVEPMAEVETTENKDEILHMVKHYVDEVPDEDRPVKMRYTRKKKEYLNSDL